MNAVDLDRLLDRLAIANEVIDVAERQAERALANAEELLRPKLVLQDADRRIVRLVNAPVETRRQVTPLKAHHTDPYNRRSIEQVAVYVGAANDHDVDFKVLPTAAGRDFVALLEIGLAPGVAVRRYANGTADLLALFE